jgi:hypothetical protein
MVHQQIDYTPHYTICAEGRQDNRNTVASDTRIRWVELSAMRTVAKLQFEAEPFAVELQGRCRICDVEQRNCLFDRGKLAFNPCL